MGEGFPKLILVFAVVRVFAAVRVLGSIFAIVGVVLLVFQRKLSLGVKKGLIRKFRSEKRFEENTGAPTRA